MFGLQFLTPLFLAAGAAAASLPLIIHLLNRERARQLVFSTIRFIKVSHQVNVQRHQLKQLILLLMRILILVLLGLAFARPFFAANPTATAETGGKRNVVVILDNSYSMGYLDTFDRAKKEAVRIVDELHQGDTSALILTTNRATVVKPLDAEHSLIKSAVMGTKLTDRTTDYLDAIQSADEMLQEANIGQKQIYLIGDLQRIGWESFVDTDKLSAGVEIAFVDVGTREPSNLAITGLSVPQVVLNEQKPAQVVVRVQNFSDQAVENLPVKLFIDDNLVGTTQIDIEPNDVMDTLFQVRFQTEETHTGYAALPDDDLEVDNRRYFLLQSLKSIQVHCVNGEPARRDYESETFFLQMAMGEGLAPAQQIIPIDFTQSLQLPDPAAIREYDVIILANVARLTESEAQTLRAFVGDGGGLIITVGDRVDLEAYRQMGGAGRGRAQQAAPLLPCNFVQAAGDALNHDQFRVIATINYNHPIFRPFKDPNHGDFGKARFYRYLQAVPLADSTVLASFDDGSPALFEKVYGNGRVLCFTSTIDREWTDLPIHGVYLPFLHETIKYLALKRTDEQPDYRIGDPVELSGYELPGGTEIAIFNPVGAETRTRINEQGGVFYDTTESPGIYSAHVSGGQPRYFVVNPDTVESDLTPRDSEELTSMLAGNAEAVASNVVTSEMITQYHEDVEKGQGVWWYMMLGLFALAVTEMFFANRI
ncbi:MAG: BatA domain-containing protein [Candidatus Poribacteria bacterium]|nr:BatA domain-containing protein [Candidatus Poribacteria bacterium]